MCRVSGRPGDGAASSSITYTLGGAAAAAGVVGHNATFSTVSFPATGLGVVFIFMPNAAQADTVTIGGASATLIGSAGTFGAANWIGAYAATIASSGNKAVVVGSTAGFPGAAIGCISFVAAGASPTPTAASRAWGFRADPQTTGTTLTLATGGLLIAAGWSSDTTLAWQVPAVAEVNDSANSKLYMARSSANDDPSFTSSAAAGAILGLSFSPA